EPRATSATGRRALVTGGSGAIGGAVCRRLARDGHHVYVHSHRGAAVAEALVGEIRAGGGEATLVSCDLTDGAATRASLAAVLERGPIQILVNNAGVHDDAVLPGMSATQWQRVIDVSVNGFFNATQPLLLPMIRPGSPEEVAAVVSFLVSEEAAYVTAQVISVSGGMA